MGALNFNAGRWKRHAIPVIVWLLALLSAGMIFLKMNTKVEITGRVADFKTSVASFDRAIIKSLNIELYEPVKKGQVLGIMDDSILRAELNLVKAELKLLQSTLALKKHSTERKFLTDVESARLTILQLRSELEPDKIKLMNLDSDLKRYTALAAKGATTDETLKKTEFAYKELAKKIQINESRLKQSKVDLEAKRARAVDFEKGTSFDGEVDYIRNALNVESLKLQDIEVRLKNLVLRAPIDGIVTRIRSRVGDVVEPAEEVFVLVVSKSTEVLAYVSPEQLGLLNEGDDIVLRRANVAHGDLNLKINHLGPAVEELPKELWLHPKYAQYGVPVTVTLPEGNELIPGEIIKLIKH